MTATLVVPAGAALAKADTASRCPTEDQRRLLDERGKALEPRFDNGLYDPANIAHAAQPVTFTPSSGSESLQLPFKRSRSRQQRTLTFSVTSPMPITASNLAVALQGDLRRTDGQTVFPLGDKQAVIVPEIRDDGRLVSILVCIDPGQPSKAEPGRYQGRIAWNTSKTTSEGSPLVSAGELPVEITLQLDEQWRAWLAFIGAFLLGMAVKVVNDIQRNLSNQPGQLRSNQEGHTQSLRARSRAVLRRLIEMAGLTVPGFVISTMFALGAGWLVFWAGYYHNPEFIGDFTGDWGALFGAIFTAVVAAHVGAGSLSGSLSRPR